MRFERVDERTVSSEINFPRYRVYFWERGLAPEGINEADIGFAVECHEATNVDDVRDVIAWADVQSGPGRGRIYEGADRTYVVYAVAEVGDGQPSLVRLAGHDPNSAASKSSASSASPESTTRDTQR